VAVEAAIFTPSGQGQRLEAYRRTHHLSAADFGAVRDDFDYRRLVQPALLAARIGAVPARPPQALSSVVGGGR